MHNNAELEKTHEIHQGHQLIKIPKYMIIHRIRYLRYVKSWVIRELVFIVRHVQNEL